jgi:amidase
VADTVAVLNVLQDRQLVLEAPRPLRIAWSVKPPVPARVDPRVREALQQVLRRLEALGHTTLAADPSYQGVQASFLVRYTTGVAEDLARLADPSLTERRTRLVALIGRGLTGRPLARALRLGERAAARLAELPGGADVLITPSLAGLPLRVGALRGLRTLLLAGRHVPFTPTWNVTGQPALSIPAGFTPEGLPLAVQLIGPPGSEQLLLSLAAQLEDWTDRRPALD